MFSNLYQGKRVFVTGHTGFKGSWLSTWLLQLGAEVYGYSLEIPTQPSIFEELQLESKLDHTLGDIRDLEALRSAINAAKPDFIFHLAAQPIVSTAYQKPVDTLSTNIIGSAHVLEVVRELENPCSVVMITSDKCYENVEWPWGYKETDQLGGKDIYSASKGAAELICSTYYASYIKALPHIKMATARAGNVIGGGDWAVDRIVADAVRAWSVGDTLQIRCPDATRPWQHVLEPLSGYLLLGQALYEGKDVSGESYNFGPRSQKNHTVEKLIEDLSVRWGFASGSDACEVTDHLPFKEAGLLKLNCDKALFYLNWEASLEYEQTIEFVGDWYYSYYKEKESSDIYELTQQQISDYALCAKNKNVVWACDE